MRNSLVITPIPTWTQDHGSPIANAGWLLWRFTRADELQGQAMSSVGLINGQDMTLEMIHTTVPFTLSERVLDVACDVAIV